MFQFHLFSRKISYFSGNYDCVVNIALFCYKYTFSNFIIILYACTDRSKHL